MPQQRARLLAALSVGGDIIRLRELAPRLGAAADVGAALAALASGRSAIAIARLRELDRRLASSGSPGIAIALQGSMLNICEVLAEHAAYFDASAA
jgi:hypothetical protein